MKKIVVVVPSYKNEKWCERNMHSILSQNYDNFRVIFVDDCSPDNTATLVEAFVARHNASDKVHIIRNSERLGAMRNLYNMIHSCDDGEVIVCMDGDDHFTHSQVLKRIDVEYNKEIWMTYGSYQDWPRKTRGCCKSYEESIINANSFRHAPWRASHPRTFYASLFKKIKEEDFFDPEGNWLDMAWDLSFMLPMLEMCGHRHSYMHDILYDYNNENPISDWKVNQTRQGMLDGFIRRKPKYSKLDTL